MPIQHCKEKKEIWSCPLLLKYFHCLPHKPNYVILGSERSVFGILLKLVHQLCLCFSSIKQKCSTSKLGRDLEMRVCWKYLSGKWRLGQLLCQLEGVIVGLTHHNMWSCQYNSVWSCRCCHLVAKLGGYYCTESLLNIISEIYFVTILQIKKQGHRVCKDCLRSLGSCSSLFCVTFKKESLLILDNSRR